MKKGRFLWSAHRITERQKAGKARNIKGKQLKNSRNTASKPREGPHSFQRDKDYCESRRIYKAPECLHSWSFCYADWFIGMQEMMSKARSACEWSLAFAAIRSEDCKR